MFKFISKYYVASKFFSDFISFMGEWVNFENKKSDIFLFLYLLFHYNSIIWQNHFDIHTHVQYGHFI